MKMDSETQKRWNDWAQRIARAECNALSKAIFETMGKRLIDLEREVKELRERQPAPAEEWPLRAAEGGKR